MKELILWLITEHFCPRCKRKLNTAQEAMFVLSFNECIQCDHVRGDL